MVRLVTVNGPAFVLPKMGSVKILNPSICIKKDACPIHVISKSIDSLFGIACVGFSISCALSVFLEA